MKKLWLLLGVCCVANHAIAQQNISLNDLSSFKTQSDNWRIVGDASVDITKNNVLNTLDGKGILACIHQQGKYGMEYELLSNFQHSDIDLELDFMLAKGSNSGIYLQGNYEIQLYDSWGKRNPKYNDCGGIYERWNDAKPEGEKGYEGTAPRVNAAKAAGLWQHIKIAFQAARFDASGKKIANAKILNIELNGMTLHENVELTGPTRGSLTAEDVATGPLRIQGDHGSLAIKNIQITNYDKQAGSIASPIEYVVYYGNYKHDADLSKLKIDAQGTNDVLTYEVLKNANDYVFVEKGKYFAPTEGIYTFKLQVSGNSTLKIDGKEILDNKWTYTSNAREASILLTAGMHTFEIFNNKRDGWMKPTLGFWSSGPGFRETAHHALSSVISSKMADPILVEAKSNTVLRSFMDFKKPSDKQSTRVVHAISVGSPDNIHYTYNLDKGSLVQVWRGGFLDATPMWNDRGDGSSRPMGSITPLSIEMFLGKINAEAAWKADTTGSGFRPQGYDIDENDLPTFHYVAFGSKVDDAVRVSEGKYFTRTLKVSNPSNDLVARLAEGTKIEQIAENLFAVDNKSYYIQVKDTSAKPTIRTINGKQELVVSLASGSLAYDLLF